MIAFIHGRVVALGTTIGAYTATVLTPGGVGFKVHFSRHSVPELDAEVSLHVHHQMNERGQSLFGFATEIEQQIFEMLIDVNGLGPGTALSLLSSATHPHAIVDMIVRESMRELTQLRGVGKKLAGAILHTCRERATELAASLPGEATKRSSAPEQQTISALQKLGFSDDEIEKAMNHATLELHLSKPSSPYDLSTLLGAALHFLGNHAGRLNG